MRRRDVGLTGLGVLLVILLGFGVSWGQMTCTGTIFNDVNEATVGLAFCHYIELFSTLGITSGCSVTPPLYCPGNPVTRGQMAVFLTATLDKVPDVISEGPCAVGQVLKKTATGFTCADDLVGSGIAASASVNPLDGTSSPGVSDNYSRGDHKHGIGTGAITSAHIADGTLVNADISGTAAIDVSKLSGVAAAGHNHDALYVKKGEADSITSSMIANATIAFQDIGQNGCSANQIMKWNGAWGCADDMTGTLTLPYSGTTSTTSTAFSATQNGTGWGIAAISNGPIGVRGESNATGGGGVAGYAYASGGTGVYGQGSARGIAGYSTQTSAYGAYGESTGASGIGVGGYGTTWGGYFSSTGGVGVYGVGPTWGGYFTGNVYASGNVGIGTENPSRKVHIKDSGPRILIETTDGYAPEVNFASSGTPDWAIYKHPATGDLRFYQAGDQIIIKNGTGRIQVKVLEILGGADLSEQFDVKGINETIRPSPGMVVSIDKDKPGNLVISNKTYDKSVAGIISGAGGVNPGMLMGQEGSAANGTSPVALTGRVYCWADASKGPIEPGDMLTTSEIPGHAMKVTDYPKAQGAVIGKAMTGLAEGRGLILVLVSLQ